MTVVDPDTFLRMGRDLIVQGTIASAAEPPRPTTSTESR